MDPYTMKPEAWPLRCGQMHSRRWRSPGICCTCVHPSRPPLWARRQHVRLSRSGPGFDPRSWQISWVRFFWGFFSPVRQMSGSFRPPRSPNIIWPSLSSSIIIHYGHQWPEMLMCPNASNIHTYIQTEPTLITEDYRPPFHSPVDSFVTPE